MHSSFYGVKHMTLFFSVGDDPWRLEQLEYGIASNAELWGLLQPYEHLIAGRTATGE